MNGWMLGLYICVSSLALWLLLCCSFGIVGLYKTGCTPVQHLCVLVQDQCTARCLLVACMPYGPAWAQTLLFGCYGQLCPSCRGCGAARCIHILYMCQLCLAQYTACAHRKSVSIEAQDQIAKDRTLTVDIQGQGLRGNANSRTLCQSRLQSSHITMHTPLLAHLGRTRLCLCEALLQYGQRNVHKTCFSCYNTLSHQAPYTIHEQQAAC
jgi:hypothetical protein